MESQTISIRGAAEHNLNDVDVDIPKNKLVVFTGVSGSGKSSLAFDTLFAEGQRRYVESLSSYARQFLGQMDKPHYDSVRGLTPTIAVSQGSVSRNPRSTVGTMTEISDYLRVLFARVGVQHCYQCGKVVERQSAAEIVGHLLEVPAGTKFVLLAPLVRERKGSHSKLLDEVRQGGFSRIRLNGEVQRLDELRPLDKNRKHTIEVVIDRLRQKEGIQQRLTDSVETGLKVGQGHLICAGEGQPPQFFSERLSCPDCEISFPDLVPASFSFNSPLGMCPQCNGLGSLNKMDTKLVVPDPSLSLREGAVQPWAKVLSNSKSWNTKMITALAKQRGFKLDTPWCNLSKDDRRVLLFGNDQSFEVQWQSERIDGRITMEWEGAIPAMMRRLKETKSEQMRKFYLSYMSDGHCTACSGARLRQESRAVRVGALGIGDFNRVSIEEGLTILGDLELKGNQELIGRELVKEINNRLGFLTDVGL
ncbi:MAG: excinuclease ABC subunit UvrA, partial [Proteobacteria bacterium]|nr:excinuclease ABC subunit UvrA [Pseudomonadota bacterium]